ncbi:hypothetical protein FOZ63_020273, partial [Perkinsus olseni]
GIMNQGVAVGKEDWKRFEDLKLLPMSHLSEESREILRRNTPLQWIKYPSKVQCLNMVKAIMADPPPQYNAEQKTTNWIFEFYKDNEDRMEQEVANLKRRR